VLSTKTFLEGAVTRWKPPTTEPKDGEDQRGKSRPDCPRHHDGHGQRRIQPSLQAERDGSTKRIPIIIVSGFSQHLKEKMDQFEFIMGREWPARGADGQADHLKDLASTIGRILG